MEKQSIKKNIVLSTFYQILTVITPFITAPYISRVLGADGIGLFSYTNSIVFYFTLLASLGFNSYGSREIARKRDDKSELSKLFFEIELSKIITSLISIISWAIFIYFSDKYVIYYMVLTLSLFNAMFDITWFYSGLEQFKYTVTKNSIIKILEVVLIFLFVKAKNDLLVYMIIMTASNLLGTISMWFTLPKFLQKVNIKQLRLKNHFKETFVYFIPTIATSMYTVLDKTLIGVITKDESQNGYYEQANRLISIIKAVTFSSVNTVMGSRVSYLFEKKEYAEIKQMIESSMNFILLIAFGCCFGLIAVSASFVPIFFGVGYDSVVSLLRILSPIVLIVGISNCLGSQYYTPAGYRGKSSIFLVIGASINVVFNLLFIPKFGCNGAAVGSIIAELVITILYFSFDDGYFTLKQLIKISWKKFLSALVMLFVVMVVDRFLENTIISLLVEVFLGIVIYILIIFVLKDKESIKLVMQIMGRKEKK